MNVWINNPFDNLPGEGSRLQRYALLARALQQAGHAVIYWTSDFHHLKKAPRSLPPEAATLLPGVEFRLIPTLPYTGNISFKRAYSHYLYAQNWHQLALDEHQTPDLIITSLPPLSLAGVARKLAKHFNCKTVVDIQDAWPETFERILPKPLLWPLRRIARRAYRTADGVSAVGETYLQIARSYGCAVPMHLCYHGIDIPKQQPHKQPSSTLRLLYIGNLGAGYHLAVMLEVVKTLTRRGIPVQLDIAGDGPQRPLIEAASAENCWPIHYHGFLRQDALQTLLNNADCGIIPLDSGSFVAVPYKLADYWSHGLAVLNGLPGETFTLTENNKCGLNYDAGDTNSLASAIIQYHTDKKLLQAHQQSAHTTANELFDARHTYPIFTTWLEQIVGLSSHQ